MTQRTENRIWRGLFLAAIVGVGIAAGSAERSPSYVQGFNQLPNYLMDEDGTIWNISSSPQQSISEPYKMQRMGWATRPSE
ncbi:MAG: hypothetical protein CBC35_10135 [Planctomycetes bacterium TMED75]|nr:hypothetical protein [Planctomycetaceae bacterium]OUU91115.1 MAG: hypothetical protein CBC35_10135 [Planctomycetes bacterium TMED75]